MKIFGRTVETAAFYNHDQKLVLSTVLCRPPFPIEFPLQEDGTDRKLSYIKDDFQYPANTTPQIASSLLSHIIREASTSQK